MCKLESQSADPMVKQNSLLHWGRAWRIVCGLVGGGAGLERGWLASNQVSSCKHPPAPEAETRRPALIT